VIWALRGAFLLQALLGLGLSRGLLGMRPLGVPSGEGDLHMLVGIVAAVLALIVLRPRVGESGMVTLARFFPMVPLAFGLLIRFGGFAGIPFVVVHVLLGVAAVGLVESAIAGRRRTSI
jgi:hypothetical protein